MQSPLSIDSTVLLTTCEQSPAAGASQADPIIGGQEQSAESVSPERNEDPLSVRAITARSLPVKVSGTSVVLLTDVLPSISLADLAMLAMQFGEVVSLGWHGTFRTHRKTAWVTFESLHNAEQFCIKRWGIFPGQAVHGTRIVLREGEPEPGRPTIPDALLSQLGNVAQDSIGYQAPYHPAQFSGVPHGQQNLPPIAPSNAWHGVHENGHGASLSFAQSSTRVALGFQNLPGARLSRSVTLGHVHHPSQHRPGTWCSAPHPVQRVQNQPPQYTQHCADAFMSPVAFLPYTNQPGTEFPSSQRWSPNDFELWKNFSQLCADSYMSAAAFEEPCAAPLDHNQTVIAATQRAPPARESFPEAADSEEEEDGDDDDNVEFRLTKLKMAIALLTLNETQFSLTDVSSLWKRMISTTTKWRTRFLENLISTGRLIELRPNSKDCTWEPWSEILEAKQNLPKGFAPPRVLSKEPSAEGVFQCLWLSRKTKDGRIRNLLHATKLWITLFGTKDCVRTKDVTLKMGQHINGMPHLVERLPQAQWRIRGDQFPPPIAGSKQPMPNNKRNISGASGSVVAAARPTEAILEPFYVQERVPRRAVDIAEVEEYKRTPVAEKPKSLISAPPPMRNSNSQCHYCAKVLLDRLWRPTEFEESEGGCSVRHCRQGHTNQCSALYCNEECEESDWHESHQEECPYVETLPTNRTR